MEVILYRYFYYKDNTIIHDPKRQFNVVLEGTYKGPRDMILSFSAKYNIVPCLQQISCDPNLGYDVHGYLSSDAYRHKNNIIGYLKFDDKPLSDHLPHSGHETISFYKYSKMFGRQIPNRSLVITMMIEPQINLESYLIGGIDFLYVDCPESGRGKEGRIIQSRQWGTEVESGVRASCDNENFPTQCKDDKVPPVVSKLGMLMPDQNVREYNLIPTSKHVFYVKCLNIKSIDIKYSNKKTTIVATPESPYYDEYIELSKYFLHHINSKKEYYSSLILYP